MPLALNPPNGVRSSTAVALWLLKKVTPVRSCRATVVGVLGVGPTRTEEAARDVQSLDCHSDTCRWS